MAIRLFLSACVASLALGAAWAEKGFQAEGPQAEGPEAQIHYAPRENLESIDVREIGRAQLSIDMAAYVLSDRHIIGALIDAAERGVVIRLYLSTDLRAGALPKRCSPIPMWPRGSRARVS